MNRLMHLPMLAGITIATIISGCSPSDDEIVVEKEIIRPVKLITIEASDVINIRRFPAELKASEEADLAFRVGGQLAKIYVTPGQRVKKGELLAELDPTDFQLSVELAKASQKLNSAQFERIQTMHKQKAATLSQYDTAKANLDQSNNALEQAQNQLKYSKVYAPFSGVISSVATENFQYVGATQPLMHIQNIDQLEVEFQIPENLIVNIRSSASDYRAPVSIDVAPEDLLYGTYKEHHTTADPNTQAYKVMLSLVRENNSSHTLLPGMTANVDIDLNQLTRTEQHFVVPTSAVMRYEDTSTGESKSVVWVYDETSGSVATREVSLGGLEGNHIEILTGLSVGDKVVAAGVHSLTESMKVRPWTRERGL
ncbi:efflux RND transporter periplasmic adaptor subunit [Marinomonas sp. C2222]|uniref:Efflux RND transporter periplasmic adaptor subunit n=1 Tax=Marinomonas sargassi TaxID=2984494 RepID=A0ABT2YPQ7_9GAMM|nr:efflux RND transporter periplasmic adaptor subunit [Marinomonas sargassi]MCV2401878.1 efflux RND transporter periplasmic adaptor subunit [Marinomonas sargassi]